MTTPDPTMNQRLSGPQFASLAPRKDDIALARRRLVAPFVVLAIPLVLLLIGLSLRIEQFTARLPDLPVGFSWIFASFAVVVLAALIAVAVHRAARGNHLGDLWRSAQHIDRDTAETDQGFHQQATELDVARSRALDEGDLALDRAQEIALEPVRSVERGRMIAGAVLRVPAVPDLPEMPTPEWPRLQELSALLSRERAVGPEISRLAATSHLTQAPEPDSVWGRLGEPVGSGVDTGFLSQVVVEQQVMAPDLFGSLDPHRLPADSDPHPSRRRFTVIAVVLGLLVVAVAVWLLLGSGQLAAGALPTAPTGPVQPVPAASTSAPGTSATVPTPASPALPLIPAMPPELPGMREGLDYAYISQSVADGARWSCEQPIPVRAFGADSEDQASHLAEAVSAVASASGLPLVVGPPVDAPLLDPVSAAEGTLTVSFLDRDSSRTLRKPFSDSTLGHGGPVVNNRAEIIAGHVTVLDDPTLHGFTLRAVLLHELAHAVGLGHADSAVDELMTPSTGQFDEAPTFGPGDTYALRSRGCDVA